MNTAPHECGAVCFFWMTEPTSDRAGVRIGTDLAATAAHR